MNNNKLNNKGYMLVEIIVASVIALVMAYFLIDITVKFVNKNNDFYVESVLLTDKAVITKEIMDDINNKKLIKIEEKNESEFELYYDDNTSKKLTIDSDNSMITYGDYSKKISEELNTSDISLKNSNNILTISLDMYTNYSDNDYGIEINVPHSEDIEIVYADLPKTFEKIKDRYTCKKTTDFSAVSTTDEGLCEAEDDLGTSYYFRGNVNYNYVKFGKYNSDLVRASKKDNDKVYYYYYNSMDTCKSNSDGASGCKYINYKGSDMYWRIVRVNGDGSLRIVSDSLIKSDRFAYDSFSYANFSDGKVTGNSIIKGILDDWYLNNIVANGYDQYVSDSIFCNDLDYGSILYSYKGYGEVIDTVYATTHRLKNNKPSLVCVSIKNETEWETIYSDSFDVVSSPYDVEVQLLRLNTNDIKKYSVSNGRLRYPVGLLTSDEIAFAGGVIGTPNTSFYLYNGNWFWTMSAVKTSSRGYIWNLDYYLYIVDSDGYITTRDGEVYAGIRPVISLKSDLKFKGKGTKDEPFEIAS